MTNTASTQQQFVGSIVEQPGYRVVRGPDWDCSFDDNGEGFLGTIVSSNVKDNNEDVDFKDVNDNGRITVIWDSGRKLRYCGREKKYDLRLLDPGLYGAIHPKKNCVACGLAQIQGMRWKCKKCRNLNLCTTCYMKDCHKINHQFYRKDTPESEKVLLTPRSNTGRTTARGIFVGAEVLRGPDWTKYDVDGGDVGYVVSSSPEKGEVRVLWKHSEQHSDCRVGANGYVDVVYSRFTETATGDKCRKHCKVVLVGDGCAGMTAMMIRYTENRMISEYIPTVFDTYSAMITIKELPLLEVEFNDTAGQEDYDRLRPLAYPFSDAVFMGYSIISPASFDNLVEKWVPEIKHYLKNVPIILVGCKKDLRRDQETIQDLKRKRLAMITTEQGAKLAKRIGAVYFYECSSVTGEGVKDGIEEAIRIVMTSRKKFDIK